MTTKMRERIEISSDIVRNFSALSEATQKETVAIRIIKPGWGSSGYYSAEMLERDGPRVFTEGLHMYLDHPTFWEDSERPERTVKDLAGVLASDAKWFPDGPIGPGLYAEAKILENHREMIAALAPHIGLSIRAYGFSEWGEAEGQEGNLIVALVEALSVDFVTQAGAGGKVLEVLESQRKEKEPIVDTAQQLAEATQRLSEATQKLSEANTQLSTVVAERDIAVTEISRLREAIAVRDAQTIVATQLAASTLTEAARERLSKRLVVNPPMLESGELDRDKFTQSVDAAIAEEAEYLASVLGAGTPSGMPSSTNEAMAKPSNSDELEGIFKNIGLSESAAKVAATGR